MKLNINAKELLALHNLLYEKFESSYDGTKYEPGSEEENSNVQLRQVYNRLKACIVAALTNRQVDPVDAFLSKEQAKIDRLKEDLTDVKKDQTNLVEELKADDFFVPGKDETFDAPEYPRRGRGGHRGGNRGGHKR